MAKFDSLRKSRLTNAQHFAFIEAFITALTAAGFTAQKILDALAALVAKFAVENEHYMKFRASEIVAQRTAADLTRDSFYTRLHRLVQAWAGSGMELLDAAATQLKRIFDLYKVKTTAQLDEETGQLDNLITDLETQEMQDYITTINGMYLFTEMKTAHELVKSLRLEEGVEVSEKVIGALADARKECDSAYDEVCALIEAASLFADDTTPYETFIRQWNGTIKIYQDMLDRKSSGGGGGKQDDPDSPDEPDEPDAPAEYHLMIGQTGSGSFRLTDDSENEYRGNNQILSGTNLNLEVTPATGKVPTATINSTAIALTENDGKYVGSFAMPAKDSLLEIHTGSNNSGGGGDGLDKD